MAQEAIQRIRKIKLSSGQCYQIYDAGALRLNENNVLVTGDDVVDEVIVQYNLKIAEIDDVPVTDSISAVLVRDPVTGEIKQRTVNQLLMDIGGISYDLHNDTGVLEFKLGK